MKIVKRLLARLLGVRLITEDRLLSLGFKPSDDGRDLGMIEKHGIEVWEFFNPALGEYWLVDMLDQVGVDRGFKYMHELEQFFDACGLDMYSTFNPLITTGSKQA